MPTLNVSLLGPPQIELNRRPLTLKPRKALAIFICLAVTEEVQARDTLATLFWPEASQADARAALRRRLSELRGALGEEWMEVDRESVRLAVGSGLRLDVADYWHRLRACQAHGHAKTELCPACHDQLTSAVALYRGDFLSGFSLPDAPGFDEWQFFQREGLRQAQANALESLVHWHQAAEDYAGAVAYARAWLVLDPLHEPVHRQLIQLYSQLGQRAAAMRQYEECQRLLAEELGVQPDATTVALYAELKRHGSGSSPASAPLPASGSHAALTPEDVAELASQRFVGRDRELAALTEAMASVRAGHGQIRIVTGEAGLGKTMLVQKFMRQAQATDPRLLAIVGHCNAYTGVGDPYLPFRETLALLTAEVGATSGGGKLSIAQARRLEAALPTTLPALVENAPDLIGPFIAAQPLLARAATFAAPAASWLHLLTTLSKRSQEMALEETRVITQYTAVLKTIARSHPLLIVLEDLHWIDASSSALLFHLSRVIGDSRILIVGTYRPEEVAQGVGNDRHPLAGMVAEFKRRHGAIWLDLGEMMTKEGRNFVDAYVDTEPNRLDVAFRDALFHHTAGHALFTVELLRTMEERGDLRRGDDGRWVASQELNWHALPAKVEGVIERQLTRLDDTTMAILRVASVQGEVFTAEVIGSVLHLDMQTLVRQLSQELGRQQRLVSAQELAAVGGQRLSHYRFRHYLFQRYLYQSLDEMERAYLHEAVGNALESLYGDQAVQIAVQLAYHFRRAGLVEKASLAMLLAGGKAQQIGANHEAVRHLRAGLALLETLPPSLTRSRHELDHLVILLAAMNIEGNHNSQEVEAIGLRALALCQQLGDGEQAKMWPILAGLFWVYFMRGSYRQARQYAERLLEMGQGAQSLEPQLIGHWLMAEARQSYGEFVAVIAHVERVLSLYDPREHSDLLHRYSNVDLRVACYQLLSINKWFAGYPDQAREYNQVGLHLAADSGHPYVQGNAILQSLWIHDLWREVDETKACAAAVIRIAIEYEFDYLLTQGHMFEGCILIAEGQAAEGMARLQKALAEIHASGNTMAQSHYGSLQVRGYMALGQYQAGIKLIDDALAVVDTSGEHWFDAELHRLKGELLLLQGEAVEVVLDYFEKAISIAQSQHGKIWELRATVSLCRLWHTQGRTAAAHARLAEIYGWFTEGFGTPDLQAAQTLLAELARDDAEQATDK